MKRIQHNKGEISFVLEVLLFIIVIFIIWLLAGGANKPVGEEKPFIVPLTDPVNPGATYGPKDLNN